MTLAIYCAGGLGKEVLAFARSISRWEEILFIDDVTDLTECHGARVLRFEDIGTKSDVEFVIANGEPSVRKALYEKVKAVGYPVATLISPAASISEGVQIGEGCILYDCVLSSDVIVQENSFLNGHIVVGHDAVIGANSILSHCCFLGGKTILGECVYMAPGSIAKDRIKVGDYAIVGMGAVLFRNVRQEAVMIGNPARRIGLNERHKVFGMFD